MELVDQQQTHVLALVMQDTIVQLAPHPGLRIPVPQANTACQALLHAQVALLEHMALVYQHHHLVLVRVLLVVMELVDPQALHVLELAQLDTIVLLDQYLQMLTNVQLEATVWQALLHALHVLLGHSDRVKDLGVRRVLVSALQVVMEMPVQRVRHAVEHALLDTIALLVHHLQLTPSVLLVGMVQVDRQLHRVLVHALLDTIVLLEAHVLIKSRVLLVVMELVNPQHQIVLGCVMLDTIVCLAVQMLLPTSVLLERMALVDRHQLHVPVLVMLDTIVLLEAQMHAKRFALLEPTVLVELEAQLVVVNVSLATGVERAKHRINAMESAVLGTIVPLEVQVQQRTFVLLVVMVLLVQQLRLVMDCVLLATIALLEVQVQQRTSVLLEDMAMLVQPHQVVVVLVQLVIIVLLEAPHRLPLCALLALGVQVVLEHLHAAVRAMLEDMVKLVQQVPIVLERVLVDTTALQEASRIAARLHPTPPKPLVLLEGTVLEEQRIRIVMACARLDTIALSEAQVPLPMPVLLEHLEQVGPRVHHVVVPVLLGTTAHRQQNQQLPTYVLLGSIRLEVPHLMPAVDHVLLVTTVLQEVSLIEARQ